MKKTLNHIQTLTKSGENDRVNAQNEAWDLLAEDADQWVEFKNMMRAMKEDETDAEPEVTQVCKRSKTEP